MKKVKRQKKQSKQRKLRDLKGRQSYMQELQQRLKEKMNGLRTSKHQQLMNLTNKKQTSRKKWIIDSNIRMKQLKIYSISQVHSRKH